ncbi:VanZ family protein [bacterium SCSIO 12643]|nr:VanZ family protein [bacterium SCSIO 12643]
MLDKDLYLSKNKITIFWALLIAVLSFLPGSNFPKMQITNLDLVIHFFFYSTFSFLLILGNVRQTQFDVLKESPVFWGLIVSIFYGGMVEIIQGTEFVSRSTEFSDFIANSVGSIIGWILFQFIYGPNKNFKTWNERSRPKKILENNRHNFSSSD